MQSLMNRIDDTIKELSQAAQQLRDYRLPKSLPALYPTGEEGEIIEEELNFDEWCNKNGVDYYDA